MAHIKIFLVLFLAAALYAASAFAGQACTVTLKNGNVLNANACRMDGRRIYLKYPAGEAALPASDVATISTLPGGGGALPFQTDGEQSPVGPQLKITGEAPKSVQAQTSPVQVVEGLPEPPTTSISGPGPAVGAGVYPRRSRLAVISKAMSDAIPDNGTITGSVGGEDSFYNPMVDSLVEQLSTADDKQSMEITKKLNELLGNSDNTGDSIDQR